MSATFEDWYNREYGNMPAFLYDRDFGEIAFNAGRAAKAEDEADALRKMGHEE